MKAAGIILIILGLAGVIIFGLQALNNSETFSLLGIDIAVSSANWTPVFVSGLILIVGFVMSATKRK